MTFREVQVQEVLDVQWGDTKTTKSSYVEDGYLAYSATGPDGFLAKYDYDCDGIVLSAIGANCGSTFFATNKWSCIKNTIRILPRSTQIDLKYFYFMTKSPNFWPLRGSAQPFISQTDIREMVIKIPDLATQKKIGEIIYALELQIEKNNEIAKTLEEIAQTIFKSWFVGFDPVKAKMAGEKPVGMDDETAALFPDSMEDSELGPIPKGWSKSSMGNFVQAKRGKVITKSRTIEGSIPVIAGGLEPAYFHNAANVSWPAVTISASGANAGFVRLNLEDIWASDCSFISRGETAFVYTCYLFLKVQQEIVFAMQQGGAQPHIYPSDLSRLIFPVPGDLRIFEQFEQLVTVIFETVRSLDNQTRTLSAIRDALLPRLISGELQIPEEMLAS